MICRIGKQQFFSDRNGVARYVALQQHYNLMERDKYEGELANAVARERLSSIPYFALASGFLTGKYRAGSKVESQRAQNAGAYLNEKGIRVLAALDEVAAAHGATVATDHLIADYETIGLANDVVANNILPADGVMLLHTITSLMKQQMIDRGLPITDELVQFIKFILTEIFPGGWTPTIETVQEHSAKAGFTLTRRQSLQPHYARTLDLWAEALAAHKSEAIEIQSEEVYERYMKYVTGCAKMFRIGYVDVNQFTLEK